MHLIYFTFVKYVETRAEEDHCFQISIPVILLQLEQESLWHDEGLTMLCLSQAIVTKAQ